MKYEPLRIEARATEQDGALPIRIRYDEPVHIADDGLLVVPSLTIASAVAEVWPGDVRFHFPSDPMPRSPRAKRRR